MSSFYYIYLAKIITNYWKPKRGKLSSCNAHWQDESNILGIWWESRMKTDQTIYKQATFSYSGS